MKNTFIDLPEAGTVAGHLCGRDPRGPFSTPACMVGTFLALDDEACDLRTPQPRNGLLLETMKGTRQPVLRTK